MLNTSCENLKVDVNTEYIYWEAIAVLFLQYLYEGCISRTNKFT